MAFETRLASSWFSKHFSMHELDKANFRSMLEKSDLGRLVLFYASKVGFWAIEGNLITKKENIEQLSDTTGKELEEIIFEKVLKNEEYDITKSDTINFVVKNGFSFFDFRLEVSNRVVDILVDSSGIGFEFLQRIQLRTRPVGQNHGTLGADDERTGAGQFVAFGHLCQLHRRLFAVVPCHTDRSCRGVAGALHLEADDVPDGPGFVV